MLCACAEARTGGSSLQAVGMGAVRVAACGSRVLPVAGVGGSRNSIGKTREFCD